MRIDTGGRDPSVRQYLIRGIGMLAAVVVILGLLFARYEGVFETRTDVTAELTDVGDGLVTGSDVRYNGMIVGTVAGITVTDQGTGDDQLKKVELDLDPRQAEGIPVNTTARTVPSNLFGVNSVELIQPADPSADHLTSGDVVPADRSAETIRLQDAQNDLRDLLRAVPPEDLAMVLTAISDALEGDRAPNGVGPSGGEVFSMFVPTLNRYWQTLNAQFPDGAPSGFDNFNNSMKGIAESTPELLDTLGNAIVPAMTIAEKQRELAAVLSAGQGLLDEVQAMFAQNGDGGIRIVRDLNTTIGAAVLEPDSLPQAIHELNVLAGRVLTVFTGVNGHVQLNLGISFGAFKTYSRQNCPVYDGGPYGQLRGPGCVGPGTGTGPTSSGPLDIYPPSMQRREITPASVTTDADNRTLGAALGREPAAADTLMLGPLVSSVTAEPAVETAEANPEGGR